MQIDWTHFTPGPALAGGVLIGLAAAWLLLFDGRILGAAGVFAGLANPRRGDWAWRLALLAGLVLSPALAALVFQTPKPEIDAPLPVLIAGGLLVGFGTRLANGCTSGHGVCGLARLSPRSAAATLAFMATGFLTVFLLRHVAG
jgi:uncharacterized membrane protein YedE/YeeE